MKKKFVLLIALLTVIVFSCMLAACGPGSGPDYVATVTVRFNNNYDGTVTKAEVEAGKTVTLIEAPARTGYTFVGWYLSYGDDATQAFDATQPVNSDLTVFAKWERDTSVSLITLKYCNLITPDTVNAVSKGGKFVRPENPVYDRDASYSFVGWYTDESCTQVYDFESAVSEDLTLYAGWKQEKTLVRFDSNYGANTSEQTYATIGEKLTPAAAPSRDRYEFSGWYTSRVGGEPFDFDVPVTSTEKLTLYAHWLRSEYTVVFNLNGAALTEELDLNYVIRNNQSAQSVADAIEDKLTYKGHDFGGWVMKRFDPDDDTSVPDDSDRAELSSINDDMTVYAYWTLQEYEVAFDYNYEGAPEAPATQKIKYGRQIGDFEAVAREGYKLLGWFTEAECVNQFTFDMPVEGGMTLYAKWIDNTVSQENVKVNYYYNVGSGNVLHAAKEVEFGGTAASNAAENPAVTDFYFSGWFEDEAFSKPFNLNRNLTEDVNVYAKMLKKYTFEAEAVDLTGMHGMGSSTNSFEEQMIYSQKFIGDGSGKGDSYVSNGWFIREMFYNGAAINFEIYADEDVTDAVMFLRVSSDTDKFAQTREKDGKTYSWLSETDFKICVNSFDMTTRQPTDWLKYGGMYIPMANLDQPGDLNGGKTPFEDALITVNLSLKKGRNDITLYVDNNNDHGGTFQAEAPLIDCMYIYSDVHLEMEDYEFYTFENTIKG